MNWNDHSKLTGSHALLSPSQPSWLNYDDHNSEALFQRYSAQFASDIGTALHDYARQRIMRRLRLNKSEKNGVLNMLLEKRIPLEVINLDYIYENYMEYINDAIGFMLDPEIVLYYSPNCYGTADAINFRKDFLRIHDYKSGRSPVHIEQLEVYAALFCLEYKVKPSDIQMELRIYQKDNEIIDNPDPSIIESRMEKIINEDKQILTFTES